MKYAIKYYTKCSVSNVADEIIIIWHKDDTLEGFEHFQKDYPNARIIIDIREMDNDFITDKILPLLKGKEVTFLIDYEKQSRIGLDIICQECGKFFFGDNVTTMDTLKTFISCGVSDVYITEDLGFNLKEVSLICKEKNVQVRCYPNIAQDPSVENRLNQNQNRFWSFFIRPEDECFFSKYVDVYEFKGPLDRQPILMNIYKSHKWDGDLRKLILGLDQSIMSYCITPMWGEARTRCKHKCDKCRVCENTLSLALTMEDNNKRIMLDYGKTLTEQYIQQLKEEIVLDNK